MKRLVVSLAALCAALASFTAVAVASTVYGVAEDATKYADDGGASIYPDLKALGMTEDRWTLVYDPANPDKEFPFVDRAAPVAAAAGIKIVLSVYPVPGQGIPLQAGFADTFCAWVKKVAARYRSITTFIVGNEVNASRFWPQGDAGIAAYYATLKTCYDALKAVSPSIVVVGMGLAPRAVSESSTKPLAFIRKIGALYKADGRTAPRSPRPRYCCRR